LPFLLRLTSRIVLLTFAVSATAQSASPAPSNAPTPQTIARPARPTPPIRNPHSPGFVAATELPDGTVPPANVDGNVILGPTHPPAAQMTVHAGVPQGTIIQFTMNSAHSKFYPGIARQPGTFGTPDPANPARLIVTTSHPAPYTRRVTVYIPKQYVPGTVAPFIVGADGPDSALFTALNNLIAEHKVPVMIAISISNGGGDAQGSERGMEYDTMSGKYAEFVEQEGLAAGRVESPCEADQKSRRPSHNGRQFRRFLRVDHGVVSPGAIPPRPDLLRYLCESAVALQSANSARCVGISRASNPEQPSQAAAHLDGGWRSRSLQSQYLRDNMHDWVVANEQMAKVFAAKGYHYQFVFARNAGHVDRAVKLQTLPEALEYVWQGYPVAPENEHGN